MATVYGSYVKTNGSGSTKSLRSYITYTTSTTETQVTLTIKAGINIISGWHTDAKIAKVLTVAGTTAYSATNSTHYNTGSTQIVSKTYTYTRDTTAASKAFNFKLTPSGQSASTASASISVPAKNQYTITFNNQNGTDDTYNTQFYGTTVNSLPTPTYNGYNFIGWNTAANGTGTTITAPYTITKNITLYAQWRLAYVAPVTLQCTTYRVNSSAITPLLERADIDSVPMDSKGEYAFYKIITDLGQNIDESQSILSNITYTSNIDSTEQVAVTVNDINMIDSNTNERIWAGFIKAYNAGTFDTDYSYNFNINFIMQDITENLHPITIGSSISADKYVLDIAKDGMRIAFGQKATDNSGNTPRTDFGVEVYGNLSIINSLNPSGAPIVDYVIEQDVDGDWTYRIWASGLKELWFRKAIGTVTTTQGSRGGYKSLSYSGAPITITTLKSISGNAYSSTYSSAFINLGFSSSGTLSGYFQCWAGGTSGTATLSNCVVDAYIVGY